MLIIGGIQGDEPGGFLSADSYADIKLDKGNLIVIPRTNFYYKHEFFKISVKFSTAPLFSSNTERVLLHAKS